MYAYVFVNAKAKRIKEIARHIARFQGVEAAHPCWGMPDIIVTVHVSDERALNDLVLNHIAKVPGVEHTDTHIALT